MVPELSDGSVVAESPGTRPKALSLVVVLEMVIAVEEERAANLGTHHDLSVNCSLTTRPQPRQSERQPFRTG